MKTKQDHAGTFGELVICPVCGHDYVHPVALKAEPVSGDTVVYINRDGVRTFHKGITSQEISRGPDWADPELMPRTIWRD